MGCNSLVQILTIYVIANLRNDCETVRVPTIFNIFFEECCLLFHTFVVLFIM